MSSQPLGGTSGASGQIEVGFKKPMYAPKFFFSEKNAPKFFFSAKNAPKFFSWQKVVAEDGQDLSENTLTAKN